MKNTKRRNFRKKVVIFSTIWLSVVVACVLVIAFIVPVHIKAQSSDISKCDELDLRDTADCLEETLSEWWYYNESNTGADLTEERLMKEGGVCSHASVWYSDKAAKLGYYSKEVIVRLTPNELHQFTVISNQEGYCVLDQNMPPRCYYLAVDDE